MRIDHEDALKTMRIIPRTPSPEPVEEPIDEVDFSTLTHEELVERARRGMELEVSNNTFD